MAKKTIEAYGKKLLKEIRSIDWKKFSDQKTTEIYIVVGLGTPATRDGHEGIELDAVVAGSCSNNFTRKITEHQVDREMLRVYEQDPSNPIAKMGVDLIKARNAIDKKKGK